MFRYVELVLAKAAKALAVAREALHEPHVRQPAHGVLERAEAAEARQAVAPRVGETTRADARPLCGTRQRQ